MRDKYERSPVCPDVDQPRSQMRSFRSSRPKKTPEYHVVPFQEEEATYTSLSSCGTSKMVSYDEARHLPNFCPFPMYIHLDDRLLRARHYSMVQGTIDIAPLFTYFVHIADANEQASWNRVVRTSISEIVMSFVYCTNFAAATFVVDISRERHFDTKYDPVGCTTAQVRWDEYIYISG